MSGARSSQEGNHAWRSSGPCLPAMNMRPDWPEVSSRRRVVRACFHIVIASAAKQSSPPAVAVWIASSPALLAMTSKRHRGCRFASVGEGDEPELDLSEQSHSGFLNLSARGARMIWSETLVVRDAGAPRASGERWLGKCSRARGAFCPGRQSVANVHLAHCASGESGGGAHLHRRRLSGPNGSHPKARLAVQEAWLHEAFHWYRCQRNTRRSAGLKAEELLDLRARQPHHNIQRDSPGDRRNQPSSSFGGYRRAVAFCRRRGKNCLASKTLMCAAFVGYACHVPVISNNLPELVVDQVQCLPVQSRHCGSADQPWRLRGASQTRLLVWAMREAGLHRTLAGISGRFAFVPGHGKKSARFF